MPKPIAERLAETKARKAKLEVELNKLEAVIEGRKRGSKLKTIVGTAVLAHMEQDASFAVTVRKILATTVPPQDRGLIDDLIGTMPRAEAAA